mgnify:CR=1 FL=1
MLKVFRHHHNNIEEVRPVNGVYKVCELDAYELKYISDSPIIDQKVFLEDILLDCSMFNITQLEVITIKPECLFIDCFGFSLVSSIKPIDKNISIWLSSAKFAFLYIWRYTSRYTIK